MFTLSPLWRLAFEIVEEQFNIINPQQLGLISTYNVSIDSASIQCNDSEAFQLFDSHRAVFVTDT